MASPRSVPILDLETGNGSVEEIAVVSDQNGVVLDRGGGEQQIDLAARAFGATGSLGLGSNLRVDPGRLRRNRVDVEQLQFALHALEVLLPSTRVLDAVEDLGDSQDARRD